MEAVTSASSRSLRAVLRRISSSPASSMASPMRFSTAPYCVGIPRHGQDPIVLDFATSIVAEGKELREARVTALSGEFGHGSSVQAIGGAVMVRAEVVGS